MITNGQSGLCSGTASTRLRTTCGLRTGLAAIGKHPRDVQRIVLTHAHSDHAGGVVEMARRTGTPVAVHDGDADYAEAGRAPAQDCSLLGGWILARLPAPRLQCSDFRLSRWSAHEFGELDYDRVAFTHGPEILDGPRAAVRGFLAWSPRPRC